VQDERLLAAAARVLQDAGWQGLTIDAPRRQAVTRERPAIVGTGTARERLDRAIDALFDVIDAHLPLLLASDTVFHRATATRINFNEPFTRLFEDGLIDHSVAPIADDPAESADLLFNTACWPYVHLRGRHGWTSARARRGLHGLLSGSLDPG
jgi:hypothetical protein